MHTWLLLSTKNAEVGNILLHCHFALAAEWKVFMVLSDYFFSLRQKKSNIVFIVYLLLFVAVIKKSNGIRLWPDTCFLSRSLCKNLACEEEQWLFQAPVSVLRGDSLVSYAPCVLCCKGESFFLFKLQRLCRLL